MNGELQRALPQAIEGERAAVGCDRGVVRDFGPKPGTGAGWQA